MQSNYRKIGDFIQLVDIRNKDLKVTKLLGLSISKQFIPSVANIIGTNMANYKIIKKNQFACSTMQVRRDKKMPIALLQDFDEAIISQAYPVFEVIDETQLNPEYLMMWFSRSEFDRHACFLAVGGVRGSLEWEDFLDMPIPVPSIEKQRDIVKEYNTIVNRIKLNETLNQKLEDTAQALYKHWFVNFEFPNTEGNPYNSSGGKMVYNAELDIEVPLGWEVKSFTDILNLKGGGTPSTTNAEYWDGEIPFFTPKDVSNSYYSTITEKYISTLGLENCSSKLYPKNTIFITARGTVGAVSVSACKMAMNQSCYAIVEDENINYCYAHQLTLETLKSLINQASGAVFKALVTKDFNEYFLAKPSQTVLNQFKIITEPIYNLLLNKSNQIEESIKLKDLLLSKMSKVETKIVEV
tara:strand:+ start:119 stop:1351 length:1233 start_codon:yes stop_codon:yes gene_type:complete